MAIVWDNRRYEKYRAPLLAGVIVVSLALAVFHDSPGIPYINFPHALYFAAVMAGILYGRRATLLMVALGLVEALLIYLDTGGMVIAAAFDGMLLFALAYIAGMLSDMRGRLDARLRESDRLLQTSEDQFHVLAESTASAIVILQDDRVKYANPAVEKITGYTIAEMLAMSPIEALTVIDPVSILRLNLVRFQRKGSRDYHRYEIKLRAKGGEKKWVDVTTGMINYDGRPAFLATGFDITERKQAEEALRKSEERYRGLVENAPLGIFTCDMQGNFTSINPKILELVGSKSPDFTRSVNLFSFEPMVKFGLADRLRDCQKKGGSAVAEGYYTSHWGKSIYMRIHLTPLRDDAGKIVGTLGIVEDFTERKQAEEALQDSEEKFRLLAETSPAGILIYQGSRFVYANPATESITGYSLDELMEMAPWDVVHPNFRDKVENIASLRSLEIQPLAHYETKILTKGGEERWVENSSASIIYRNKPAGLHVAFDITERKRAEEKLRMSLLEKEVLLKEIHHRVKNNLQVVSSMLSLQSMNACDPAAIRMLQESQDRVRSMALIHEQLYRSGNLAGIDFGSYVNSLTANLLRSYTAGRTIKLNIDVHDILLSIDLAIPCGLIVNELVSNSLKHAFPDGRVGTITVTMRREDREYVLTVRDDGIGMPAHVDHGNPGTFGLQLVETLAGQLEGGISRNGSGGTAFTIRFTER